MMINKKIALVATATLFSATLAVGGAQAAVTGYVNNPTTNLQDWTAAVGAVATNVDFDGANVNATTSSTGGSFVGSGEGPGQGNTFTGPLSGGEGLHAASNYLYVNSPGDGSNTFTVDFTTAVSAAGLDVIDYFGASGFTNDLNLSAYAGADGTGALLGSFDAAHFNFQEDNIYFMGVVSDQANIGSIVFTRSGDQSGDDIGLDNVVSNGVAGGVPEPASWALMLLGFGGMGAMLRRRAATAATA
jgi:hypothetical protein